MHSSGFKKLLPQGKQKGTCLSWKARLGGIYETYTHETNCSLSKGCWNQEVLVFTSADSGYSSQSCTIPKLSPSTRNETEPALQVSPLRAGTTEFCPRALHTLGVPGCLVTFHGHAEITTDILGTHVHISPQMSTGIHSGGFYQESVAATQHL